MTLGSGRARSVAPGDALGAGDGEAGCGAAALAAVGCDSRRLGSGRLGRRRVGGGRRRTGAAAAPSAPGALPAGAPAIGRSAWRDIGRPQFGQKRSSLPWIAAQRGQAVIPASRSTVTERRSSSAALERPQLAVDVAERVELRQHERVVALAEAVQVEDEAAEVAVGQLAGPAQEAGTPPRPPARAEARLLDGWRLGWLAAVRTLRPLARPWDSCRMSDPRSINTTTADTDRRG